MLEKYIEKLMNSKHNIVIVGFSTLLTTKKKVDIITKNAKYSNVIIRRIKEVKGKKILVFSFEKSSEVIHGIPINSVDRIEVYLYN